MDKYEEDNKEIFENTQIEKVDELENLCYTLKIMIDENELPLNNNNNYNILVNQIEDNLEFINKIKYINENKNNLLENNDIAEKRLDKLNNICNDIYNKNINNINLESNNLKKKKKYNI